MQLQHDSASALGVTDAALQKGAKRLDGSLKWVTVLLLLSWLVAVSLWLSFGLSVRLAGVAWPPALLAINQDATWQALAAVLAIGSLALLLIWRYQAIARSVYRTEAGCPRCRDRDFVRVPRHGFERRASTILLLPTQRFTCRNCGWEGLLIGQSEDAMLADLALLVSAELATPAATPNRLRVATGTVATQPVATQPVSGAVPQEQSPAIGAVGKNGSAATAVVAEDRGVARPVTKSSDARSAQPSANAAASAPQGPTSPTPLAARAVGGASSAPLSMWERYGNSDDEMLLPPFASAQAPAATSTIPAPAAKEPGSHARTKSPAPPAGLQSAREQSAESVESQLMRPAPPPPPATAHSNGAGSGANDNSLMGATDAPTWAARTKTEVETATRPVAAKTAGMPPTVAAAAASPSTGTQPASAPTSKESSSVTAQVTPAVPDPSTLKWPKATTTGPASHPKPESPPLSAIPSEKFDPRVAQAVITAPYGLKLRAEPRADATVLGLLPADSIVKLLDSGSSSGPSAWQQVQAGDKTGWVATAFLRRLPGKR